jgi:glycosyltransferase involved in cell wall biosynthesis
MTKNVLAETVVVHCPQEVGGVRQVTEALADGIAYQGRAAVKAEGLMSLVRWRLRGVRSAVLSLQTGVLAFLFRRSVYILHGYPRVDSYSLARRVAIRVTARLARMGGAKLVAVSHLTRAVHERIYGIPVDAVIFNGCSAALHSRATISNPERMRSRWVTYVGRLIDGKGIKTIVEGFIASRLPSSGYELRVAGRGPLEGWLRTIASEHPQVVPLGGISECEKDDLLYESEAFVSMNDFEPMGVVFVEALMSGCKIVAPLCGGHREFIPQEYPLSLCDPADLGSVRSAFDRLLDLDAPRPVARSLFDYRESIAPRYIQLLDGHEGLSPAKGDSKLGRLVPDGTRRDEAA